jgi:hypothetical protein
MIQGMAGPKVSDPAAVVSCGRAETSPSSEHFSRYFIGSCVLDILMKALKRGVRLLGKQGDSEDVFRILS